MSNMQRLLLFLVEEGYTVQIKGKSWMCMIALMDGMENTKRYFKASYGVVFTPEMVKSVEIFPDNHALITFVN